MDHSPQLVRLLHLIRLLQSEKPYRPDDLARELQVSRRTLFRDLAVLRSAQVSFSFSRDTGSYEARSPSLFPTGTFPHGPETRRGAEASQ